MVGGPIGLMVALIIRAILSVSASVIGDIIEAVTTRICEDCAETIKKAAKVCPHCGAKQHE